MKKLFVVLMMLLAITAGAFAMDFGVGYVASGTMSAISITYDPIPLITIQGAVSLINAGIKDPSIKYWTTPDPEPAWETILSDTNWDASVSAGSFGLRALFNLERPTPNTKFYVGAGINVLFLSVGANVKDTSVVPNVVLTISGGGYAVDMLGFAGFEYRPKEVPNLGLYAEAGYGITCLGEIGGSIKASNGVTTTTSTFKLQPNAYLGRTFCGIGATWYF